jgi:hypothetical protein
MHNQTFYEGEEMSLVAGYAKKSLFKTWAMVKL